MGSVTTYELVPNGKNIRVTEQNKNDYVDCYLKWKLYRQVRPQFEAIRKGLYEIIPYEFLSIFDEKEMELLLGGLKDIDVEDWKKEYRIQKIQIQRQSDKVVLEYCAIVRHRKTSQIVAVRNWNFEASNSRLQRIAR